MKGSLDREHASMDASVPVGDVLHAAGMIADFLQKSFTKPPSIKDRIEKLAESKANPNIAPELKHYMQIPDDMEDPDVQTQLSKLEKEIEKKNPGLSSEKRLNLTIIAYIVN